MRRFSSLLTPPRPRSGRPYARMSFSCVTIQRLGGLTGYASLFAVPACGSCEGVEAIVAWWSTVERKLRNQGLA